VPVIVSRVPPIASELHEKRVCLAVNNSKEEIVAAVRRFLSDPHLQDEFKANIRNYVNLVDIDRILDESLEETMKCWKSCQGTTCSVIRSAT